MLADGKWRIHQVESDNAPYGRELHSSSPYRWWLTLCTKVDRAISGRPLGPAVEHAAYFADPLLHFVFLIGTAAFVAYRFGFPSAAAASLALATLMPWSAKFIPGAPDHHGLAQGCTVVGTLFLLAGAISPTRAAKWFFCAGVASGCGFWINLAGELPVIGGTVVGALLTAWMARCNGKADHEPLPWAYWSYGGAAASLVGYALEYMPGPVVLRLEVVHPLHALTWIGGGVLLTRTVGWIQQGTFVRHGRDIISLSLAGLALISIPLSLLLSGRHDGLLVDPISDQLTDLPLDSVALNLAVWIVRKGLDLTTWATVLPIILPGMAWWLLHRRTTTALRPALAFALGMTVFTLLLACVRLRWWNSFESTLPALIVIATALLASERLSWNAALLWWACLAMALAPGVILLCRDSITAKSDTFSETEALRLVERDLAHWLATHTDPREAIVVAPPAMTASLYFHGSLRGVGTLHWENAAGLTYTIRVVNAPTPSRGLELIEERHITHLIIPSWETTLDDYVTLARELKTGAEGQTLLGAIHGWAIPRWLKPIAYRLPQIEGLEGHSVVVLEVVEEMEDALAISRLADYFIEMGQPDLAESLRSALERFPNDLNALIAQGQLAISRDDRRALQTIADRLPSFLTRGPARSLFIDRRIILAAVLTQAGRFDLAKPEIAKCATEIRLRNIRSLSLNTLMHFHALLKAADLKIVDPASRQLAVQLVPPSLRQRLAAP
jgi:hypothetical protein